MSELDHTTETAVLRSAELTEHVPREVLIVPWGEVQSARGSFVVDDESARLAIEAFESQKTDLPIDYEHQTLGGEYASPSGQAPAAGWIKRLWLRRSDGNDDGRDTAGAAGLYADVDWTDAARAQLAAREYRYLSPVAIVRKSDRKLVALHSAALTNKPAIVGMRAIVNRSDEEKTDTLTPSLSLGGRGGLDTLTPFLSLEGRGGCADIEVRERDPVEDSRMAEALERLREQLGLEAAGGTEAVLVAACERLAALTEAARRSEAEARVFAAMKAGKLTEGQREWALALAMRDPEAFEAWEDSAPLVVRVGRLTSDGDHAAGSAEDGEAVIAARARAEFRAHPELELLTSEEAYVALAAREGRTECRGRV